MPPVGGRENRTTGLRPWKCTPIPASRGFPRRGKFALLLAFMSCGTMHSVYSPTAKRGGKQTRFVGERQRPENRVNPFLWRKVVPQAPMGGASEASQPPQGGYKLRRSRHHNPRADRRVKLKNPPAEGRSILRTFPCRRGGTTKYAEPGAAKRPFLFFPFTNGNSYYKIRQFVLKSARSVFLFFWKTI